MTDDPNRITIKLPAPPPGAIGWHVWRTFPVVRLTRRQRVRIMLRRLRRGERPVAEPPPRERSVYLGTYDVTPTAAPALGDGER